MMRGIVPLNERSGTTGAPTRRGLLDGNRIGRRKGVLEGFVERLFLTPALVTIAIVLMRFAFRIGNHFGFSDRAAKDFRAMTQISVRSPSSGTPFASSSCRKRSHGDTSIGSFWYHGRGWKLSRQRRRRGFHHGDAVPHRPLHLLEGTHAYLAHALARDAELVGKLAERDRFFGEPTRLEDASLQGVGGGDRRGERLAAVLELLARGECRLLVGMLVDQPVLPFAGITVLADRGVERGVAAAEPAVHVDHVGLGDAELPGDDLHLVWSHVALVEHSNLVLGLAQVKEQLLLVHGGAHLHQRPRAQDVFLDRRLDPPCGIGGEPEALVRLEAFDRLHQTDVALRDQFGDRQAIAAMAPGDLGNEAQMTIDELVRRPVVAVLAPALGEHVLFVRFQHRDPLDFLKIAGEAGFGCHPLIRGRPPSHDLYRKHLETQLSASYAYCQFDFETLLLSEEATMSARETAELLLLVGRLVQA